MPTLLSVEKRKVFSVPYEELFRICEDVLLSLGLKITEKNESSGYSMLVNPVCGLLNRRRESS